MAITISDKLIYFGMGCGIGLVLGALFAPKSGEETRQDLSHKVDELTDRVQEKINASGITDAASQTWNNVMGKGKDVASMGRQRLNDSIEAARLGYNAAMEDE